CASSQVLATRAVFSLFLQAGSRGEHERAPNLLPTRSECRDGPRKAAGFSTVDRRTAAAREAFAFKQELVSALGGEADLSPQRRPLIDMAVRAALLLDHVDAWLFEQESLVNKRTRALLPVLTQRQALADHLARLLDRLGLDRVPRYVQGLHEILAEIAA